MTLTKLLKTFTLGLFGKYRKDNVKIQYKYKNFRKTSLDQIDLCNEIIEQYQDQGLRLTLRQLYYQLVTRNALPNIERSYKNLSALVSDARLAGLMDWEAIEDRVRQPRRPSEFTNLEDLTDAALAAYRRPRWTGQDYYAELWVEKDALAGVLAPLAYEFHVTLMVNRGYSSQSPMFESAERFRNIDGQQPILFYIGDHDPSGEDMVRDIEDRLKMFGVEDIEVKKLALTMDQVEQYNPPPNPAKTSDPRASSYSDKHGGSSWEVDALRPEILSGQVREAFKNIIDEQEMDMVKQQEETDKELLRKAVKVLS